MTTIYDLAKTLDEIGLQFLASIGLDGKAKVRPVQYMVIHDGKMWFCTNSEKEMYKELNVNPYFELCGSRLQENEINTQWIRFSAKAIFEEDLEKARAVKNMIMEKSPIVRELYKNDVNNPIFKVFYIEEVKGSMTNLGHVKGLKVKQDFAKPVQFEL